MSALSSLFKNAYPNQYKRSPLKKGADAIPMGSVILFSSNKPTLIQWLIQKINYARVCHAGTYWGRGANHSTIEAEAHGVQYDNLDKRLDESTMMWIWRFKNLTMDQIGKMHAFAEGEIGVPYDYLAIADFVLGGGHPSQSKTICSGSVVRIYAAGGIKISDKIPDKTSPEDLDRWFRSRPNEWSLWDTQNTVS